MTFTSIASIAQTPGYIYTIGGGGVYSAGFSGDGGPATSAKVNAPWGIAVDSSENVYFSDYSNQRIRRIDHSTGYISTVFGNGTAGISSGELNYPTGVALADDSTLYIADTYNYRVLKLDLSTGAVTTVVSGITPVAIAMNGAGKIEIVDTSASTVYEFNLVTSVLSVLAGTGTGGYSGDGGAATSATLNYPQGVAAYGGNIYIADNLNNVVRKVDTSTGIISTVAGIYGQSNSSGDGGVATSAHISNPYDIAFDGIGNMFVLTQNSCQVRKIDVTTQVISTVAGTVNSGVCDHSGDSIDATTADIFSPRHLTIGQSGNLYIAETSGDYLREVYKVFVGSIDFSPSPVSFTTTAGTSSASQTITVYNHTGLNLTGFTLTDSDSTHFVRSSTTCASSFAANASCTFSLACSSTTSGTLTATIIGAAGAYSTTLPLQCVATSSHPTYNITAIHPSDYAGAHEWESFTVTTDTANGFAATDDILISGTGNANFDGYWSVDSVLSPTQFKVSRTLLSAASAYQGTVTLQ